MIESTKYRKILADIDNVFTRHILSTKTIFVRGMILKSLQSHVAITIGTHVPGPLTNKSSGLIFLTRGIAVRNAIIV